MFFFNDLKYIKTKLHTKQLILQHVVALCESAALAQVSASQDLLPLLCNTFLAHNYPLFANMSRVSLITQDTKNLY